MEQRRYYLGDRLTVGVSHLEYDRKSMVWKEIYKYEEVEVASSVVNLDTGFSYLKLSNGMILGDIDRARELNKLTSDWIDIDTLKTRPFYHFTPLSELYMDDIYDRCRAYLEKQYPFVDACDIFQITASDDKYFEKYTQFETGCDDEGNPALRNIETGDIIILDSFAR